MLRQEVVGEVLLLLSADECASEYGEGGAWTSAVEEDRCRKESLGPRSQGTQLEGLCGKEVETRMIGDLHRP